VTSETRRGVAYIVGRLASERRATAVYDTEIGRHFLFSGEVAPGRISVYDYMAAAHIVGTPGSLYHHGNSAHLNLSLRGRSFSGYDFHSGDHFSGTVNGSNVSIYDSGFGKHFVYFV
jgi:hypothetical protein